MQPLWQLIHLARRFLKHYWGRAKHLQQLFGLKLSSCLDQRKPIALANRNCAGAVAKSECEWLTTCARTYIKHFQRYSGTPSLIFDGSKSFLTLLCLLPQKSAGGLILTGASSSPAMQDALIGKVVAVGSAVNVQEVNVKVGDNVLYSKYSTSDVETEGGAITFVAEKSILAVLS